MDLSSSAAIAEGLGGLPAHVEVEKKQPYQLLAPVHRLLARSQYHQMHPEIQPVVYVNAKDAEDEEVENGGTITLKNEFGEWTVRAERSPRVARGVMSAS